MIRNLLISLWSVRTVKNIEAHKVIISASSPIFRDILKINKHSHPLIYMRGVKAKNLSYIVNFMYYGEVSIYQDELNDFLTLAEELKLKGLTGTSMGEKDVNYASVEDQHFFGEQTIYMTETIEAVSKVPVTQNESIYKAEDNVYNSVNEIVTVVEDDKKIMVNLGLEELDEKIEYMLVKKCSVWTCNVCGKSSENRTHVKNHIEAKHITGMEHPCSTCGKTYRSHNSLNNHISLNHNAKHKISL